MSKFDLFGGDEIAKDLLITKEFIMLSDIISLLGGMMLSNLFIVEHNGREVGCRVIVPNEFFTFKASIVSGNRKVSFITDMKRLCKDDKRCVFEDRDGDKYPISSVKVVNSSLILIASKTAIISRESLLNI